MIMQIVTVDVCDILTGGIGVDIFLCGPAQDMITDFNQQEGNLKTPDCENS